jgi:hypothetical protein
MPRVRFTLAISADDYLRYYQGAARNVAVTADDGSRIKFPAEHLRPYVMHDGIRGRFELHFDETHKFIGLRKL